MNTAKDQNTFFLKLEKQRGYQNMTKNFVDDKHIVRTQKQNFTNYFSKKREQKTAIEVENFFSDVLKLSENQARFCEKTLTEKDLYNSLKSM